MREAKNWSGVWRRSLRVMVLPLIGYLSVWLREESEHGVDGWLSERRAEAIARKEASSPSFRRDVFGWSCPRRARAGLSHTSRSRPALRAHILAARSPSTQLPQPRARQLPSWTLALFVRFVLLPHPIDISIRR